MCFLQSSLFLFFVSPLRISLLRLFPLVSLLPLPLSSVVCLLSRWVRGMGFVSLCAQLLLSDVVRVVHVSQLYCYIIRSYKFRAKWSCWRSWTIHTSWKCSIPLKTMTTSTSLWSTLSTRATTSPELFLYKYTCACCCLSVNVAVWMVMLLLV